MDRLKYARWFGTGLGLILAASGCKTPRSEVPPGRPYLNDGRQAPPVGFSSEPPPATFPSSSPDATMGGATGSTPNPFGSTSAGMSRYGAPSDHGYGPPATSSPGGMSTGSSALGATGTPGASPFGTSVGTYPSDPNTNPASLPPPTMPPNEMAPATLPEMEPLPALAPPAGFKPVGSMGESGAAPSPY